MAIPHNQLNKLSIVMVMCIAMLQSSLLLAETKFAKVTSPQKLFGSSIETDGTRSGEASAVVLTSTSMKTPGIEARQVSCGDPFVRSTWNQNCEWQVLPHNLLYRSYIAAPHEPRMATVALFGSGPAGSRWDSTLGGRVGLLRRNRSPRLNVDRWQIDLEGAVMVRLNPQQKMDLESSDYRFGLQWTGQRDDLTFKFGYFHISSHVGDEFLVRNPTFNRINYVRESLVFGVAQQTTPEVRLYGEIVWGFIATGGAEPFQLQYGAEYSKVASNPLRGAPFAAINLQHHQENDFAGGVNLLAGWQWRGPVSGRSFRIGLQYFNGPSNQYQFFQRHDNQFGLGAWFDF